MKRTRWTFENFPVELNDLQPLVRNMAIEIANKLMDQKGFGRKKAIKEAIKQAEEWFLNEQG